MQNVVFLIACLLFVLPVGAQADWKIRHPDLQKVGTGVLKVFFMDIYILTLHSKERDYQVSDHFALEFNYKKSVSKKTIIDASIDELSKAPSVGSVELKAWKKILEKGISDMQAGEKASVVFSKSGNVEFWSENRQPISFQDLKFAKNFAAIWLGPKTSYPKLRLALLGKNSQNNQ
ncbi:MAG: chalcone isomerase family protein [Candidatus Puniceispirillum sp.]|nr:chalcone isomerase family protein [Candidatus Puniceispirillum sp.]